MFGYVRPGTDGLTEADRERFAAVYCGLCRVLGSRYGPAARCILNYDLAFLAVLLWPRGTAEELRSGRCAVHPVKARSYFPENGALVLAADYSVILTRYQLLDKLSDPGGGKAGYRAAERVLRGASRRAGAYRPAFDASVQEGLARLRSLEAARCPSLDLPADAFASILAGAAGEAEDRDRRRVLAELLYQLGRWIYLVDAADDLREDFRTGSYNPLLYRYGLTDGTLTEEARAALAETLDCSVRRVAAAFELIDFSPWGKLIESVAYQGLYGVGNAVLSGTFHGRARPGRSEV